MNAGPINTCEVGGDFEVGEFWKCCWWLHRKVFQSELWRNGELLGRTKDFALGRLCKGVLSRIIAKQAWLAGGERQIDAGVAVREKRLCPKAVAFPVESSFDLLRGPDLSIHASPFSMRGLDVFCLPMSDFLK